MIKESGRIVSELVSPGISSTCLPVVSVVSNGSERIDFRLLRVNLVRQNLPGAALDPLCHLNRDNLVLDIRVAIFESLDHAVAIAELVGLAFAVKDGEAVLEELLAGLEAFWVETLLHRAQVFLATVSEVAGSLSVACAYRLLLKSDTVAQARLDLQADGLFPA